MKITVEANSKPITDALAKLSGAYQNLKPVMEGIGALLASSTEQRFMAGRGPDGQAWKPLSEVTKKRRRKGPGSSSNMDPLRDTGVLMNGITHNAGRDWLEVGSPEIYAAMQQFGAAQGAFGRGNYKTRKGSFPIPWGDVPGRPFLGLSDDDDDEIMRFLSKYMEGIV